MDVWERGDRHQMLMGDVRTFADLPIQAFDARLELGFRTIAATERLPIPAARYSIDWDEQSPYNLQFFSDMLRPVLEGVMGHSLCYLFLKIPPETILAARLVGLRLPALETLHIELCIPKIYPPAMHYLEDVRLFITNAECSDHPHIRALEIGVTPTSVPFDLSTFFRHLGPFHALDTFGLSIPFNGAHLRDVTGLRAFLFAHAHHLHHLAFRTRRMTPVAAQSNPGWVLDALRGMCFAHLVSAELALRPVAGPFDIDGLGGWLREHAAGLSSIALTDRQLTLDEVAVIVAALDKEIVQDMKLRVRRLSAPLLEIIARGLPQLCELDITYISIGSTEDGISGVAAFLRALSMDRDIYEDWHSKRFRVRQPFTVLDDTAEGRLFRSTLPKLVPSFKSARIQVA